MTEDQKAAADFRAIAAAFDGLLGIAYLVQVEHQRLFGPLIASEDIKQINALSSFLPRYPDALRRLAETLDPPPPLQIALPAGPLQPIVPESQP